MVGRRDLIKRVWASAVAATGLLAADDFVKTGRRAYATQPMRKRALILLDRSGSMSVVREATVDGLNDYIDGLRHTPDLYLTLIQFDTANGMSGLDLIETFVDMPVADIPRLSLDDYVPRGSTPLRAAVVDAISKLEKWETGDGKLLLAVQTDGGDNTSPPEITKDTLRTLIESKTKLGNWTFVFMGADIDAWGEGASMGVSSGNTSQYRNDYAGTVTNWQTTSASTQVWAISNLKSTDAFYTDVANAAGDAVTAALSDAGFKIEP